MQGNGCFDQTPQSEKSAAVIDREKVFKN